MKIAKIALLVAALFVQLPVASSRLLAQAPAQAYVCPMHPDVRQEEAGKCPRCGMALVILRTDTQEGYLLEVKRSGPAAAGKPFTLDFDIRHPETHAPVTELTEVHEKLAHMFVVSSDLQVFEHVHPVVSGKGSHLALTWTPPRAGRYHFFLDVMPVGALPQLLESVVVVGGEEKPAPAFTATRSAEVDGIRASIESNVEVAGNWSYLKFKLVDAQTDQAIKGWEPWLGAWAHLFSIREGATEPVHAHPDEGVEVRTENDTNITLEVLFPRPGKYGVWLQVQREGKVTTLPFYVEVPGWTSAGQ